MSVFKAKYWLVKKMGTLDGHLALIHCKRNALLLARHTYHVSIISKELHLAADHGFKDAVIYGWSDSDIERVKREIGKWTIDIIFQQNKYLLEAARKFSP